MIENTPETAGPTGTPLRSLADRFVAEYAASDPITATYTGVPGHDDRWPDLSPAGRAAHADLLRRTIAAVGPITTADRGEEVARAAMVERLGAELRRIDSGWAAADLNSTVGPLQDFLEVFDLQPAGTDDDWAAIGARLRSLPSALAGCREGLDAAAAAGRCSSVRQVRLAAGIARSYGGGPDRPGPFRDVVAAAPADRRDDLAGAVTDVEAAFVDFAGHLEMTLLPVAPTRDGVGRERYEVESRFFTGSDLDLDEAYTWGWAELARIVAEKEAVAATIVPGGGVPEAVAALDADPARVVRGRAALQTWLQSTADAALAALDGVHFDIPASIRRIEGRLAATAGRGVYYTGPSEDLTRPGRMWWSLPDGVEEVTTWRETSIVFHEGVPGHHLQIGQTVSDAGRLNRWQRVLCSCSAFAEGWALYAERLMDELGFLTDPGDRLGMLQEQQLRAARVVLDIGVHLDLPIPTDAGLGADRWDYDVAWRFLNQHVSMNEAMLRDELHRYLGWPGQAPVYKLGERVFLAGREQARARHGTAFDLKAWHREVLALGQLGLDPLAVELARL